MLLSGSFSIKDARYSRAKASGSGRPGYRPPVSVLSPDTDSVHFGNARKYVGFRRTPPERTRPLKYPKVSEERRQVIGQLLKALGIEKPPKDFRHYEISLTHKSYTSENGYPDKWCNERYELLGDRHLAWLIQNYLNTRFPEENEGVLSELEKSVTNNEVLADLAIGVDIGKYMHLGSSKKKDARKFRADALEAIIGALAKDKNKIRLDRFLNGRFIELIDESYRYICENTNFIEALETAVGRKGWRKPVYDIVLVREPERKFLCEVLFNGRGCYFADGATGLEAKNKAAQVALRALEAQAETAQ